MKKLTLALLLAGTSLMAADGATLFKKCVACHGLKAEKHALGKSDIIAGWETKKIVTYLKGYKAGTMNKKGMGAIMKAQMASLSDADIQAVAAHVHGLK